MNVYPVFDSIAIGQTVVCEPPCSFSEDVHQRLVLESTETYRYSGDCVDKRRVKALRIGRRKQDGPSPPGNIHIEKENASVLE